MPDWKAEIRARLAGLNLSPVRQIEITEELSAPLLIGELHAKDAAGMRPTRWRRLPNNPLKL